MESSPHRLADLVLTAKEAQNKSGLFSSEAVLNILRLIFAGAPLTQVLTIIAQLVECRDDGTLCSIWLPTEDGRQLYCGAAPVSLASLMELGQCLLVQKVDPAAQLFIEENRSM
jgi:formate hydrogenlyase transcriptional activator